MEEYINPDLKSVLLLMKILSINVSVTWFLPFLVIFATHVALKLLELSNYFESYFEIL